MYVKKNLLLGFAACLLASSTIAQDVDDAPKPYGALPSKHQLAWHEIEMYCLIHFTPTTFQDKEWGYGDADPAIFNPTKFDASQIVEAAKAGGFKGIISVAKHHDGFALWPTKTAAYNISESPWRNGKGDMVKEFQQAAKKAGLKFGVYCSPWDRNNPAYGTAEYVEIYRNQLKELYSNYGNLFMSWHDGANGGDGYYGGKKEKRKVDQSTYYDWKNTWAITRSMQPSANIFSDIGWDARWVGNEKGIAPETSWSTITLVGKEGKPPMPGYMDDANLGSGTRNGEQWIPTECDVPLRPGWFYHASQDDQVKTPAMLFDLYCQSVGRGGAFDLGLSPNKDGLLHANDVQALKEFGALLRDVFGKNLIKGAIFQPSNVRNNNKKYGAANLVDADRYSYWATDDAVHQAELLIDLPAAAEFNIIRLRENIKLGQRIDSVLVDEWKDGEWVNIARATSIGANRIIRMDKFVETSKLRLKVFAPVSTALSDVGLFAEPKALRNAETNERRGIVKTAWSVKSADAKKAIDGDKETFWLNSADNVLVVDFGSIQQFSAVGYLPRQDGESIGTVEKYEYFASNDGKEWKKIAEGEFSNIKANPILQYVPLQVKTSAKFLKIVAKQSIGNENEQISIAELEVYE